MMTISLGQLIALRGLKLTSKWLNAFYDNVNNAYLSDVDNFLASNF